MLWLILQTMWSNKRLYKAFARASLAPFASCTFSGTLGREELMRNLAKGA